MSGDYIHVEIEPTNICNTVCMHCPHDAISRPYGKMDWDTYTRVLDQVMARTEHFSVEYAGMGEPLLNPLIYRFIEYLGGKGTTSLTTNASALTTNNIERLIAAGLNRLTISFNGEDQALYELMMGGLNFERAMQNISNAVKLSAGTKLEVGANVSVTRQSQTHLAALKTHIQGMGIQHIFFSKCHNRGGFLKGDVVCTTPPPPVENQRCDIFTNTLFVAWNGEVLSCCHDLAGGTSLGNLNSEELSLDIILAKKRQVAAAGVNFSICNGCNDLYRFMNDTLPDGRPIADWVYDLYTSPQEAPASPNPLTAWLQAVYTQEGQEQKLLTVLGSRLEEQRTHLRQVEARTAQELAAQAQTLQSEIQALQTENLGLQAHIQSLDTDIRNILTSRSWKILKAFQNLRLWLAPIGSRREWLLKKFLR